MSEGARSPDGRPSAARGVASGLLGVLEQALEVRSGFRGTMRSLVACLVCAGGSLFAVRLFFGVGLWWFVGFAWVAIGALVWRYRGNMVLSRVTDALRRDFPHPVEVAADSADEGPVRR